MTKLDFWPFWLLCCRSKWFPRACEKIGLRGMQSAYSQVDGKQWVNLDLQITAFWLVWSEVIWKNLNFACIQCTKLKFHFARHATSRHDTTRSTCRASRDERVEPYVLFDKLDTAKIHVVSCREVTWRAKWNFGFTEVRYTYIGLPLAPAKAAITVRQSDSVLKPLRLCFLSALCAIWWIYM